MTKQQGNKMKMFRQGDVLVVAVDSIPGGLEATQQDNGKTVLAYSEVTGHSHALSRGKLYRSDAMTQFLDMGVADFLRHEEHGKIAIKAGSYEVRQQRQWTLASVRGVAD